jgi:predicted nucleic acid-binding Zn ribbon protein
MGEEDPFPFCRVCGNKVGCCPECGEPVKSGEEKCSA